MVELDNFILAKGLLLGFTEEEIQTSFNFLKRYCDRYNLNLQDMLYSDVSDKEFSEHLRQELENE